MYIYLSFKVIHSVVCWGGRGIELLSASASWRMTDALYRASLPTSRQAFPRSIHYLCRIKENHRTHKGQGDLSYAGEEGIEPSYGGFKGPCLTAWLLPSMK